MFQRIFPSPKNCQWHFVYRIVPTTYCEFEAEGQTFLRSTCSNSVKFETEYLLKLFTGGFLSQEIVFEFAVE